MRRAHQERRQAAYLTYLRDCEQGLQAEAPDAYARFAEHDAHQRRFLDRAKLSGTSLALFDQEAQRLTRLHLFFAKEPEQRVLDFWGWDEQFNPEPFRRAVVARRQRIVGWVPDSSVARIASISSRWHDGKQRGGVMSRKERTMPTLRRERLEP